MKGGNRARGRTQLVGAPLVRAPFAGLSFAGLALAFVVFAGAEPVYAQERILSYDIEVAVEPDGALDVTERIRVRAEGTLVRRGIYRDFPTRYRDRAGNRMRVGFEVLGVERNGAPEPWFTENRENGVRINTGNDDFLPVPGEHEFTLRYRTTRQLGFFDEHDELYWNAVGTGWDFPIERASVVVRLPAPVDPALLSAEGYTGYQDAQGRDYRASIEGPGIARWQATRVLAPNEGLTIVLTFPKGLVPEPTTSDRAGYLLADNRAILIALAGFAGLLLFCFREWRRVGRDPRKGVIIPRYFPREGFTPAAHRYLGRLGYDTRCFSGDVLALAVSGHLEIHRQDRFVAKDTWTLRRTEKPAQGLPPGEAALLAKLFSGGRKTLELKDSNAETLLAAHGAHKAALDEQLHPRFFKRNGKSIAGAFGIVLLSGAVAILFSGGFGIPATIGILFLMVVTLVVFAVLVQAPTPEGREALDEIEGLKLYLTVAEKDELAMTPGPGDPARLDASRYEALLPFAVALGVEDAWTEKFTAAVGATEAARAASGIAWYHGSGPVGNLGSLSHEIGSSLSSTISSASSPPGSSSGSGGGGSSGGGGGGGGGGGR